jgi:hypothetical protein
VNITGSLRLWQWTGDGLAGAVLTSPGSDTFSEAKQKPITHVVVCPFADSPLSHPSSSDSSGSVASAVILLHTLQTSVTRCRSPCCCCGIKRRRRHVLGIASQWPFQHEIWLGFHRSFRRRSEICDVLPFPTSGDSVQHQRSFRVSSATERVSDVYGFFVSVSQVCVHVRRVSAHAPTVTTAKVAGPSGQKVTAVASLSGNTRCTTMWDSFMSVEM